MSHGAHELLVIFTVSALAVLIGLYRGGATILRLIAFPLTAIPICFVAMLLCNLLSKLMPYSVAESTPCVPQASISASASVVFDAAAARGNGSSGAASQPA